MAAAQSPAASAAVQVGDRRVAVSNLEKILYPQAPFTKGQVLDYYVRIAPVLLPHLAGRPLTRKRYPDGVEGGSFFEKNAPRGTPGWVRTVRLPVPGSTKGRETIDFVVLGDDDLAALVWVANLAALELHVPQWRVSEEGKALDADLLVLDLDPGEPATIVECCQVALLLREALAADGLVAYPKTSGSKGLQLYAPLAPTPPDAARSYARRLARQLERSHGSLVVSAMTRRLREGKVLIDWSQNAAAKTAVAPYSLRARAQPTASTPLAWAEVERCSAASDLVFTAPQVLERVARDGDLLGDLVAQKGQRGVLPGGSGEPGAG